MMISNLTNPLGSMVYTKIFQRYEGYHVLRITIICPIIYLMM